MSKGKRFFSAVLFGLMGMVMLIGVAWLSFDTLRLGLYGKEAEAMVEEYVPSKAGSRKTGRTYHYHIVNADGYRFKVELGRPVEPGARIHIVYLPKITMLSFQEQVKLSSPHSWRESSDSGSCWP